MAQQERRTQCDGDGNHLSLNLRGPTPKVTARTKHPKRESRCNRDQRPNATPTRRRLASSTSHRTTHAGASAKNCDHE